MDRFRRFDDHSAGREIRARHEVQKLSRGRRLALDQMQRRVDDFSRIVRRDRRRHANGNAGCAIRQQVGKASGQHDRFRIELVIRVAEIDGIFIKAVQKQLGRLRHTTFGVTHCGGSIAVDIAEIALPIDQRVAYRKVLREADQRIVNRAVAMGVIVTHHLTHDFGAFAVCTVGIETQFTHTVEYAPLHRLQAVPHVWQRPGGDRGQRVGQITLRQRLGHRLVDDVAGRLIHCVGHGGSSGAFCDSLLKPLTDWRDWLMNEEHP